MAAVAVRAQMEGVSDGLTLAAVLLARLTERRAPFSEKAADAVLTHLEKIFDSFDIFTLEQLRQHSSLFPDHVLQRHDKVKQRLVSEENRLSRYRQQLRLVCEPSHALRAGCEQLVRALRNGDEAEWNVAFDKIRCTIFENPFTGLDYTLLKKYQGRLYDIRHYDTSELFINMAMETLRQIYDELKQKSPQRSVRLSNLCPALNSENAEDREECLRAILSLSPGVTVVRFEEEVRVFADSLRRPCVLSALLSDGRMRRYVIKCGEPVRGDCAAQLVARTAAELWGGPDGGHLITYRVIPLYEDCGIMEFLEGYERVRGLIIEHSKNYNVEDAVRAAGRPDDHELVLTPAQALLQQHALLCGAVPASALRSAIKYKSSSTEEFIAKKRRFTATLGSMTLITWILGLGDRHLQNLLCAPHDGSVCAVDWGAVLQYGSPGELPPVRLTRNLLALTDTDVLENTLQQKLTSLRTTRRLLIAAAKFAFHWMGPELQDKLQYISDILEGRVLSVHLTRRALLSREGSVDRHLQLLQELFPEIQEDVDGDTSTYSVEEQITSVVRQSTAPRVLAATRSGWEPWL